MYRNIDKVVIMQHKSICCMQNMSQFLKVQFLTAIKCVVKRTNPSRKKNGKSGHCVVIA